MAFVSSRGGTRNQRSQPVIDPNEEELLTVAEAAEVMKRHTDTVRAWIASGKLDGVRLGGRTCTSREAIRRFCQPANTAQHVVSAAKKSKRERDLEARLRKQGLLR